MQVVREAAKRLLLKTKSGLGERVELFRRGRGRAYSWRHDSHDWEGSMVGKGGVSGELLLKPVLNWVNICSRT